MKALDAESKQKILKVLQRHHVVRASIFGSVARGEGRPGSDLDVLVEFDPTVRKSLLDLVGLESDLRETLGMEVEVVTYRSLHPLIKDRVLAEQLIIL